MLVLAALLSAATPEGFDLGQTFLVALFFGLPLAGALAVLAYRLPGAVVAGDPATRLVALVTADLPPARREWGAAMRAELTIIDDAPDRRRFALGCAVTAVRMSVTGRSWAVATAAGASVAVLTLVASRVSLSGERGGIMLATVYLSALILFAAGAVNSRPDRSFRSGLIGGLLAAGAALVGMLMVATVEAVHWELVAGAFVMDGDIPKGDLGRVEAALDPLSPHFLLLHLLVWVPMPVFGALVGTGRSVENPRLVALRL